MDKKWYIITIVSAVIFIALWALLMPRFEKIFGKGE